MALTRLDHDDVAVPDGTLRVATAGEGPLVVFCHGFPGPGSSSNRTVSAILMRTQEIPTISVDLTWNSTGTSRSPAARWNRNHPT